MSNTDWEKVYLDDQMLKEGTDFLCNLLKSQTPTRCIFIKRDHSINKKAIVIKFYCRHKSCKSYKVVFDKRLNQLKSEIILDFYESENSMVHKNATRRNVKGQEKQLLQAELRKHLPKEKEMTDAIKMDPAAKEMKDLDCVYKKNVYKNNRKAALSLNDQDPDFFTAMELDKLKMDAEDPQKSYIAVLQKYPFEIAMYSEEQLSTVVKLVNMKGPINVCCDFTENIVHDIYGKSVSLLRIVTSVPVINSKHTTTLTLLDALSIDKTYTSVKVAMSRYKRALMGNQKSSGKTSITWPLFKSVTVDKDLPLYYGLNEGLNGITYSAYLSSMYEYTYLARENEETAKKLIKQVTIVLNCFNHFMHTISDHIKHLLPNICPTDYAFLLKCLRLFGGSLNYFHLLHVIWFHFCQLLLNETKTTAVITSIDTLNNLIAIAEAHREDNDHYLHYFETPKQLHQCNKVDVLPLALEKRLYLRSPFYHDFQQIYSLVANSVTTASEPENRYYSPEFIAYFLKYRTPFAPTFAPFLKRIRGEKNIKRSTNATVEGSFGETKQNIKTNINLHLKDRPDRIFNAERVFIEGTIKLIDFSQPESKPNKKKFQQKNVNDNGEDDSPVTSTNLSQAEKEEANMNTNELELTETKFKKKILGHINSENAFKNINMGGRKAHPKIKCLSFFENGLCTDPYYYTKVAELRAYYVAKLNSTVLFDEDFLSLTKKGAMLYNSVIEYMAEIYIGKYSKHSDCHFYPYVDSNKIFLQ